MDFNKYNKINIHFIIGPGRSGTTLLAMIFNNHKDCVSAPEIKHFVYFYKKYKNITHISKGLISDLKTYFEVISSSKNNNYFNTRYDEIFSDIKIGEEVTYAQLTKFIYLSLYKSLRDLDKISFIIDKNPFYTFHTDKISAIFPDAKFVTILRDYRAYVLSNRQSQNPFVRIKSLGYYCAAWNFHIDKLLKIKQEMKDKILIIQYENFVQNKETEMQKVFDFLKMEYDGNAFMFNEKLKEKNSKIVITTKIHARSIKTNTDLMKPVNTERIAAWKTDFKVSQIEFIETISGSRGSLFDYTTTTHPGFLKRIYYKFISIPGYVRVAIFYLLNSPKIHHYLNETRKANFENKNH